MRYYKNNQIRRGERVKNNLTSRKRKYIFEI